MNTLEYYQALIAKDTAYEGIFYIGATTTGVFCRPSCPARKPKFEHCEFYTSSKEALLASFRPCKRCLPLSNPHQSSTLVQTLVAAVENNPEKRWKESDFRVLSIDAVTARRQFKKKIWNDFCRLRKSA